QGTIACGQVLRFEMVCSHGLIADCGLVHPQSPINPQSPEIPKSEIRCRWGGKPGSATGGARIGRRGCLHVEEERGGAAPLREQPLALLSHFSGLFALLAANR